MDYGGIAMGIAIERGCANCRYELEMYWEEPCVRCVQGSGFETQIDIVELQKLLEDTQAKLRKALDAIEQHKYATTYYNGFADCDDYDKKLWEVLDNNGC